LKQTYVLDVMVENLIIIELKAMEGILPVHEAQLLTYMKLLQKPKGILIILILMKPAIPTIRSIG